MKNVTPFDLRQLSLAINVSGDGFIVRSAPKIIEALSAAADRLDDIERLDAQLRAITNARDGETTPSALTRLSSERTAEWMREIDRRDAEIALADKEIDQLRALIAKVIDGYKAAKMHVSAHNAQLKLDAIGRSGRG